MGSFMRSFVDRFFRRARTERDLEAELRSHLEMETRLRVERGEAPEAARAAARREFGNQGLVAEVTRDSWGFVRLEQLLQDVRYSVRTLAKSPLHTLAVSLTLAIGIGSTTAVYSLVHGILLRPLPFPSPDRLAAIWEVPPETKKPNPVLLNNFIAWKERSRSFQKMAAFVSQPMNLLGEHDSEQVPGLKVTSEFFAVLGTPPILGRTFRPGEYDRDEPREVILSYGTWVRRFGGRTDIVGKRISIDVSHHEIVGVMPQGFGFPNVQADFYVPLAIDLSDGRNYYVVGRLSDGVSAGAAKVEISGIAGQTARENPALNADWSATVVPLLDQTVRDVRPILFVLFGAVGLVLLLACANIANLLLMRSTRRAREIGMRLALGAGSFRILTHAMVESLLLAAAGGLTGVLLAAGTMSFIKSSLPPSVEIPRLQDVSLDSSVLAFATLATVASAVIFGLMPALQSLKRDLVRELRAAASATPASRRVRNTLVVAEVALSFVLLVGAGLLVRSFVRLTLVDSGFHAEHVLTARMLLLPVSDEADHAEAVREMLRRIRSLAGVTAAGSIGILPMQGSNSGSWFYRADRPDPPLNSRPGGDISIITPGYFRALGIPLLEGRDFDDRDSLHATQVAILNRTAARVLFPNEDAIGKHIRVWWNRSPVVEVVGVVGDIRHSQLNTAPDPCLFLPNDQQPFPFFSLVIRTLGDPGRLAGAVRQQVRAVDQDQGIAEIETMQQLVADSIARPRYEALLFAVFAAVALALSCIGIYGVIAYSVAQRSREIGVRVALGASRQAVFRMILGEGFALTFLGLLVGLCGALALTRFLGSLLFEIQPSDPITLSVAALTLTGVSLLACCFPAQRATGVDPAITLRDE